MRVVAVLAAGALVVVAGCGGTEREASVNRTSVDVPQRLVEVPEARYTDAAWLPGDRFVVVVGSADGSERRRPLRLVGEGGSVGELVPDRDVGGCRQVVDDAPTVLPDGRLGFRETCEPEDIAGDSRIRLLAWDLEGAPEVLLETREAVGVFSFAPGLREGLFSVDSSICAGIGVIRDAGIAPLDLRLPGERWSLGAALDPGSDCEQEGRARGPEYSADGRSIAFAASPASAGVAGQARLDEPWNLYVMDAEERRPRAVVEDVVGMSGPRFSPDGRWLVFAGRFGETGDGVHLVRVADGRVVTALGEAGVGPAAWAPDGREVLVIRDLREDGLTQRSELVRVDVSGVVGS